MNNKLKNFYAIIYVKDSVLRSRFISEDEYKNRYDNENRGYFLIHAELTNFYPEDAIQQLETLIKIIYRRYFLRDRYISREPNLLIFTIKEVENEYSEMLQQYTEQGI